ncbi:MAG: 30S ribosomal protein S4e [Methanomicrobiales archaeon]|nr:30S ribosomal protein S4e [Methanomicrobiales archaeon]NYT21303.1 30S ribosomal protein S4e [Methanomicrobiales archaeon]
MSDHLKRLRAPDSWHIPKKVNKFITKTAAGPHNANAMPVAVWLRDHMGYALNMKEVKQILGQRDVLINGRSCRDPRMGIGIFDIVSMPKIGKHFRILRDKKGRHKTIEIDAESAKTRLAKIRGKTTVRGGKVQLNLRYGGNVLADNRYKPGDSVVLSLSAEDRFTIVDHFPFAVGNMAMVIGGKHSGKIARITRIEKIPGSVPNRVFLVDESSGTTFDTIDSYIYMVGRETPALAEWGIEE